MWEAAGAEGGWNPHFERPFNAWEVEMVQDFICTVQNKKVTPLQKNRLVLKATKDGNFSIKSSFVQLEGGNQNSVPFKMFWNPYVPTRVCFLAWKAWWGQVLTSEQLKRRGYSLLNRCPFSGKAEEALEHLLIHCPMVWGL